MHPYQCPACGTVVALIRPVAQGHMKVCGCWRGLLRHLAPAMLKSGPPRAALLQPGRIPNLVMRDVSIINCGTGVHMSGGHADIDGLEIIDTPVGIELDSGATVNVRRARFRLGD